MAARKKLPGWLLVVVRLAWALARRFPASWIRALGRLLFSKSQARFEDALADPRGTQERKLLEILRRNRDTYFGRDHGFLGIDGFEAYQRQVPIRRYDELEPYIQRMVAGQSAVLVNDPVTFFARSSGTTGTPKYIPVTESFLDEMRACRRVWSRAVSQVFPGLVRGHFLTMHSLGIDGRTAGGTPYGSITVALAGGQEDDIASPMEGVPRPVYDVEDFDTKYYLVLRAALDLDIRLMGALNPSTLLLLCQRLNRWAELLASDLDAGTVTAPGPVPEAVMKRLQPRLRPRPKVARRIRQSQEKHGLVRAVDVWPRICGALAWKGGSAPFYLTKLKPYLGDLSVMDYGYAASEGAFNVVLDAGDGRGVVGVMGHVLEFVPEAEHGQPEARALLVDELEQGQRYAVVITASNGLYRYDINDIVEVTDFYRGLPRIRFVHKGGNMISLTGEKVGEAHVVAAADQAIRDSGVQVAGFLVTARLADPAYYCLAIELEAEVDEVALKRLLHCFDLALGQHNLEYAAKRESKRLGPPRLLQTGTAVFEGLRVARVREGAPDAHVKVPHLWRDPTVLEKLELRREITLESP